MYTVYISDLMLFAESVVVNSGECTVEGSGSEAACTSDADCGNSHKCCKVPCTSGRKCKYVSSYSYHRQGKLKLVLIAHYSSVT